MLDLLKLGRSYLKLLGGWQSDQKILVLNVDDFGNVRLASRKAREKILTSGVKLKERMDNFDAMETETDIQQLLDTLESVRDFLGQHAKLTAYTVVANPDFQRLSENNSEYIYESLPKTFERLANQQPAAYSRAWAIWLEGIERGLLRPQFHGREHLNIALINHKLAKGSKDLVVNIQNESMAGLTSELQGIGFTQAFALTPDISIESQINAHRLCIEAGLKIFEEIFGFRSTTFTPPAQKIHPSLFCTLERNGIQGIDKPFYCKRQIGARSYRAEINRIGRSRCSNHLTLVRNIAFEPNMHTRVDHVQKCLAEMDVSFRLRKPAIISSHRVNFIGHIDPKYGAFGVNEVGRLLNAVVKRWPDIRFMFADELTELIISE
jgi:hypothetical protein